MEEMQMLQSLTSDLVNIRMKSYKAISKVSGAAGNTVEWSGCMSSTETRKAFNNLKNDLSDCDEEVALEAAGVCVHLLANQSFLSQVNVSAQKSLCDTLMKILSTNKDRMVIHRSLHALAKSKFCNEVYLSNLGEKFCTLNELLQTKDMMLAVEALHVILVFFNASPLVSADLAASWFPITFSRQFHPCARIRKAAVHIIHKIGEALSTNSNDTVRSKLLHVVLHDLKIKHCKDMVRILSNNQFDILHVWRTVVTLLDVHLHTKRDLINSLLDVIEKSFKIANPEVRISSFVCWRTLIDNFALSKDTISNTKKLQLLIAPFKLISCKTENISNAKFFTWWHFICVLSEKKCLSPNFDMVVVPFLHFCFTRGSTPDCNKGSISNRNLIMSGALSSPGRAFSSMHRNCAEILAQLFATEEEIPKHAVLLPVIKENTMSSALFLRHFPLLMKCFGEAIRSLNFRETQNKALGMYLFRALLTQVKTITDLDVQKKEAVDVVKEFFNTLSNLESNCEPENTESLYLFEFYNTMVIGSLALPTKIFNSHQYHIASYGGGAAQDVMCGTLSNFIITQLCSPVLLHHAITDPRFFTLWEVVLENSQPVTGKLRFLEATIQEMNSSVVPFLCPDYPEVMSRLWGMVLKNTQAHIEKTKAVEADEAEADWSCIYSVLHFPIIHATEAFSCAQNTIYEEVMELWRNLWNNFIIIARATPTVEPNIEAEQVASTLFTLCQVKGTEEPPDSSAPMYYLVVEVLALLTETFDYSKLGKGPAEVSPSPAKAKRKPHPLHNLGTCVDLIFMVFEKVCAMVTRQRNHMADKICQACINMMEGILEAPLKYVQQFITHMGKILSKCVRLNPAVVFDFHIEQRFIDMLECFTVLIVAYLNQEGVTEAMVEHLHVLESLFTVAFNSTNNKVKQEVHRLLNVIVSSIAVIDLEVPSVLLDSERKWDQANVSDHASIEDFIEATPVGRSTRKSLKLQQKSTKNSSHKSSVSSASKKTNQANRSKDGIVSASSSSSGQLAAKAHVQLRRSRNTCLTSANPSVDVAALTLANEDSLEGVFLSASVDNSPIARVLRARKGANSQQKKEGKHTVESQENEKNSSVGAGSVSKPLSIIEQVVAVVASSKQPEYVPEDSDKTNHMNDGTHAKVEVENTTFRKMSRQRSGKNKENNSLSHSVDDGKKSLDSSSIMWVNESLMSSVHSKTKIQNEEEEEAKTQRYSKGNAGKATENSLVLQDASPDDRVVMNIPSDEETSPLKRPETNTDKTIEKTPHSDPSIKRKRINFMEVTVSPSVVKDTKLIEQHPKVDISMSNVSQSIVPDSDSEDEIPSSLEVNSSVPNSLCLIEKNSVEKMQSKEKLQDKCKEVEAMECMPSDASSSTGKRKRKLFDGDESGDSKGRKKVKTSAQDQSFSSNQDESVIELIENSFDDTEAANTKESLGDSAEKSSVKKTRSISLRKKKINFMKAAEEPASKDKETKGTIESTKESVKEGKEDSTLGNKETVTETKESEGEMENSIKASTKQTRAEPTEETKDFPTKESKGQPTEETEQTAAKEAQKSSAQETKSVSKGSRSRSCSDQISTGTEEIKTKSAFSPKVTRSGRKIVPPNKDMPKPMTPPRKSKRSLNQKSSSEADKDSNEWCSTDFVDLHSSTSTSNENSESLSSENDAEAENEVEANSEVRKSRVSEGYKEIVEHKDNKTGETECRFDESVAIIDNSNDKRNELPTLQGEKSELRSTRGTSTLKPSESQKHNSKAAPHNVEASDSSTTITISSGDSVQVVLVKRKDQRDTTKQNPSINDQLSVLKQNSDAPIIVVSSSDSETNSLKPDNSKLEKSVAEKNEDGACKEVDKGGSADGSMEQIQDSSDQQKVSDESTPMECAQTLVEEVSYPGSRRGTEALDDSGGNETLQKNGKTVSQGKDEEAECKDDDVGKETLMDEDLVDSPAKPDFNVESEEEEEDQMSAEEDNDEGEEEVEEEVDLTSEDGDMEEIESRGNQFSLDLKIEQGNCLSAGQGIEKEEKMKTQDTVSQEPQQPERSRDITNQEIKSSENADITMEKKKSEQEVIAEKVTSRPSSEETRSVTKSSEVEVNAASSTNQGDVKDCTNMVEEKEIPSESTVSKDMQKIKVANTTLCTQKEARSKTQSKDDEEPHTTHVRSQENMQEESGLVSEDKMISKEVEEAPNVAGDSDEVDKSLPKDLPELNILNSNLGDENREESQTAPGKKESMSENTDEKTQTSKQESSSGLQRKIPSYKSLDDDDVDASDKAQDKDAATSNKNLVYEEADVNLEKGDNIKGTVSSPRKKRIKNEAKPRRTAQLKEKLTKLKSIPAREKVSSPKKSVESQTTTQTSRDSEQENSDVRTGKGKGEGESERSERTATEAVPENTLGTSTSMVDEASEEPEMSSRQQEEELSPDKSSRSRLKLTVSTPERLKHRSTLMHAGSRAALLVACAKQNIKNRSGSEMESPSGVLTESGRLRSFSTSPTRRNFLNRPSPGYSPDSRRRSHLDNLGMKPWMKHSPSPGASPSTSILKRTLLGDGSDGDTPSPPPAKYRRVSFADPPVSEQVEIPPSPRTLKGIRAQKRLDMTRMASPTKDTDAQLAEKQDTADDVEDPKELDAVHPICPELTSCPAKMEEVAQDLTAPALLPGLLYVLEEQKIETVGQLSKMTELAVSYLPVKEPKVTNTRRVLREYEKQTGDTSTTNATHMDEVEQSLAAMFGDLDRDDKENRWPNQQDCVADALAEAEVEVMEGPARAPHPENIQEIMEMEDITPLDSAPDDTEAVDLMTLYWRAKDNDLNSQKKLLRHLLHTLPPSDVADAIAECIKSRMGVSPASVSPAKPTTTTTTTTTSTSTSTASTSTT